jgi:hypothetical protein
MLRAFPSECERAVPIFLSDPAKSFLGHAVLSTFASLGEEERERAVRRGPLTAGLIAALSTEDRPISGPLLTLAAAVNAVPRHSGEPGMVSFCD